MKAPQAKEHILACLSSAPTNERLINCAREMAEGLRAAFTAIYVQTPLSGESSRRQLENNLRLAEENGAEVETVQGDDIAYQIAEYVRLHHITRIFIGQGANRLSSLFLGQPSVTERLEALVSEQKIYIVPEHKNLYAPYFPLAKLNPELPGLRDALVCTAMMTAATLVGLIFDGLGFAVSTIISVYILCVLLSAVLIKNYLSGAFVSLASVIIFNFFFTEPKYTFFTYDQDCPVTFTVMFAVSLLACSLTERLKLTANRFSQTSFRTKVLFDTSQQLHQSHTREQIFETAEKQLIKLLDRETVICSCEEASDYSAPEYTVYPIGIKNCQYAAAVIRNGSKPLEDFEKSLIISITGECALTLENEKIRREQEEAAIRIKNEQFRSNLLRSVSHDLRTPLTSISGNAANLLYSEEEFDSETRRKLYKDIYTDSIWLSNLVENLLSVSRIEEGRMLIKKEVELLDDIIDEALNHTDRSREGHKITMKPAQEIILVQADARLIVQVIINLLNNAIKYTPSGSEITVSSERLEKQALVSVADNGGGIPDAEKEQVFKMFFSGSKQNSDSRRGVGMGLALCRSIIQAHGGEISLRDNQPHGCVFSFTLPLSEADWHE